MQMTVQASTGSCLWKSTKKDGGSGIASGFLIGSGKMSLMIPSSRSLLKTPYDSLEISPVPPPAMTWTICVLASTFRLNAGPSFILVRIKASEFSSIYLHSTGSNPWPSNFVRG